jgi:hypothetical protein
MISKPILDTCEASVGTCFGVQVQPYVRVRAMEPLTALTSNASGHLS